MSKAQNIETQIVVSAEEMFMGCTMFKEVTRWELCENRMLEVKRTQQIVIPPLTLNGQVLRIPNKGHQGPKMAPGDLLLTVICGRHELYEIIWDDDLQLMQSLSVSPFDVADECAEVTLKDLDGSDFTVKLASGLFSRGAEANFSSDLIGYSVGVTVPERGLPIGHGRRGKLFIRIVVEQKNYSGSRASEIKTRNKINLHVPMDAEEGVLHYDS